MQTFMPYPSFSDSAACLDSVRRWKQVVEAAQVLKTLGGKSKGWVNHPAVVMWRGHEPALRLYFNHMLCEVLRQRTHNVVAYKPFDLVTWEERNPVLPWWIGVKKFHASHRSNLLRKDPDHYGQFGWTEKPNLDYYWPKPRRRTV